LVVMVAKLSVAPRVVVAQVARLVVARGDRMLQMLVEPVVVVAQDILVVEGVRVVPQEKRVVVVAEHPATRVAWSKGEQDAQSPTLKVL
jgi:hypothetical protein